MIKFAKEFTDCPGGSLRIFGEYSGEEFREKVLQPALDKYDRVILDLNGVIGFPPSFITEAFGKLAARLGYAALKDRLILRLDDDLFALRNIDEAMQAHTV